MSTGLVVSAAIFLGLVLGEASCTTRNLGRLLERGHFISDSSHEVLCAVTLIAPHFRRKENGSITHAPRLYVFGQNDFLNEFLRRFPNVASIYLFPNDTETTEKFSDFVTVGALPSSSIALVLGGLAPLLLIPWRVRTVLWWPSHSASQLEATVRQFASGPRAPPACHRFVRALLAPSPAGAIPVLSVQFTCDFMGPLTLALHPLGAWSAANGWQTPGASLFPPACVSWRPPPAGDHLVAEMYAYTTAKYNSSNPYHQFKQHGVLTELSANGMDFETTLNFTTDPYYPQRAGDFCRMDAIACAAGVFAVKRLNPHRHAELAMFPWEFHENIMVVPAGAGRPYHYLHPIAVEFSTAVWGVGGAATLAVAGCMYLRGREQGVLKAVLQAVSPLLTQAFEWRRGLPQTLLLAVWLPSCVVLVAAYQGQLLGYLTDPPRNRDINSWQDFLHSDLIFMSTDLGFPDETVFPGLTHDRVRKASYQNLFNETMEGKAAFYCNKFLFEEFVVRFSDIPRHKFHTFSMSTTDPGITSCFLTTKGSPFEAPLQTIHSRMRAAGILGVCSSPELVIPRTFTEVRDEPGEVRPIPFRNLKSVLLMYTLGNAIAILTFVVEVFWSTIIFKFVTIQEE